AISLHDALPISKRLGTGRVGDELEAVAEPEGLGPFAVGRAKISDETGHDVEVRVPERLQERPRIPLAEEASRMRDAEPRGAPIAKPGEVVEVAPIGDRAHDARRLERAYLLGDCVG